MKCSACGGGRAHHHVPGEACWCPQCLRRPESERCMTWSPVPVEDQRPVKKRTRAHAKLSLPRRGSLRRQLYDWFERSGIAGLTDEEASYKTGHPIDQVTAGREKLEEDGLVEDSGHTRVGQQGELLTAWRVTK